MTASRPTGRQLVLLCNCVHYDIIPQATREEVGHLLSQAGVEVQVVDDLCGLAANRDPRLQEWVRMSSLAIVACFPRAVRWLFHAAGVPLPPERVRFLNMRTQSAEQIVGELVESAPSTTNRQSTIINHQSAWVPWFPVIDYDRCANCKQCLNFCLFGVYSLSGQGRVEVQKPSGCKTNCPACARMCPRQAIIFPKYADSPINGDNVGAGPRACPDSVQSQEGQPRGGAPTGDLYERIRNRSAGGRRFLTQAQEATGAQRVDDVPPLNRGQDARGTTKLPRSCPKLDSLRRELNIPDDVLASLSPTEIQRIIAQSKTGSHSEAEKKGDELHE